MKKIFYLLSLLIGLVYALPAQIFINEYSASNLNSFTDSYGKTEDWIELHNAGTEAVDLGGWYVSDKQDNPTKWAIPENTIIEAGGFLVVNCSGRDLKRANGELHSNFKLAQSTGNDYVVLANPEGTILESHTMDLTLVEHSRCRSSDGSSIWVVCTNPTRGTSNDGSQQVLGYTATPSMDVAAGFYEESQTVTITNNEGNSVLRYTLDGTNPTPDSPIYGGPITIDQTTVIKARAFSNDSDILPGKMDFNTYLINEDFTLAVFSVAADQVIELANGNGPLIPIGSLEYFNTDKEREATSFGSLNRHGQDSWVLDHRSLDWVSRDEMGYSKAIETPLFSYSDRDEYQKIMFRNSGDDNYPARDDNAHEGSTHIRDEYVQTLALEGGMSLDTRAVERVVLFLNGQYWGVYGMRDRPVDHDYTDYYYDQGKYDIQYLSTWGTSEVEYGGLPALLQWRDIRDFVLENDMSDSANYALAADTINMKSLIDYMLVNLNVVAADWLNYNTGWWRGRNPEGDHKKWGYILWDMDATFDYYINYTNVPDVSPDAEPCDLEEIGDYMDVFFPPEDTTIGMIDTTMIIWPSGDSCATVLSGSCPYPAGDTIMWQVMAEDRYCCETDWDNICQRAYDDIVEGNNAGNEGPDLDNVVGNLGKHEKIFLKLLEESPEFKQLYYVRYADAMNSVFSCENMNVTLSRMLDVIEPEMPRQIERWGGTLFEWQQNVIQLREFINARCENLGNVLVECEEDLSGPYAVTLQTIPAGVAEIKLNTLDHEILPWTGEYFGGMTNELKAKLFNEFEDDYVFSHWQSSNGSVFTDSLDRRSDVTLNGQDTLTAVFTLISNTDDLFQNKYGVSVFPNPVSEVVNLAYDLSKSATVSASLYDQVGRRILRRDFGNQVPGEQRHVLNLPDNLPAGLYNLELKIGNERKNFKLSVF